MFGRFYGDEITPKDQWNKLKGHPLKEKLEFIRDYYGLRIIVVLAILIASIFIINTVVENSIPKIISGTFYSSLINTDKNDELKEILCKKLGKDPSDYRISVTSSAYDENDPSWAYASSMSLMAQVENHDLDFFAADDRNIEDFMNKKDPKNCLLADLSKVLPKKLLNRYKKEGRLYYFEPSSGDPYPCAIDIVDSELFDFLEVRADSCYMGFVINSENLDAFIALLDLVQ